MEQQFGEQADPSIAPVDGAGLAAEDSHDRQGRSAIVRRFLALLEEDRSTPEGIRTKWEGSIHLGHYAERLGVSMYRLTGAIDPVLVQTEADLTKLGLLPHPFEQALRGAVERDVATNGRPVFGRGGRLNRQHYKAVLGVAVMPAPCERMMADFDEKYGARSNLELRLDEMRAWLEDQFGRGALRVRNGAIDRTNFALAFGLKGGTFLTRHPGIRKLFEEFDARVAAGDYIPADVRIEIQNLRKALADTPSLNKDRLTVNRTALAEVTGISIGRLQRSPFVDEITNFDAKVVYRAKQSQIDPYLGGRIFPFSDLPGWQTSFLAKVGSAFQKAFASAEDGELIKPVYLAFYDLMAFIGTSELGNCKALSSAAAQGLELDSKDWELSVRAYREAIVTDVKSGTKTKTHADTIIGNLRRVLSRLGPPFPPFETELPGIKFARAFVAHKLSLAEIDGKRAATDYIAFASSMLRQAADRYRVDLERDEAGKFIDALASEMESAGDLPSDPAHAVLLVLNRRLSAIRDGADAVVQAAREALSEGCELLGQADIDAGRFCKQYRADPWRMRRTLRDWFPNPAEERDPDAARRRSTANILQVAQCEFGGILPSLADKRAIADYGQFFQKRYLELGGLDHLASLLNPSRDACGAVLTLYLVESGGNVTVGRTLFDDCIEPANEPGFKMVTGHKARARGKPIYVELPTDSPAIKAMEWYQQTASRYRRLSDPREASQMFVLRIGATCQLATPHWYTNWFKKFASRLPGMHGASALPSMIRPSVLLKAALENDGRLQVGRAIGQHGHAVTRGYQEKLPIRILRDQHIRRFQRHYETRVLQNVVDVAVKLGIDADDFAGRLAELNATGLGTFCADPLGRPGSEGRQCQSVDCWRDCPQLLVIAEVESIALLQIWQRSLREAAGDWERDHPERWREVWLPWLCLTEVVQEKMSRGPLLLVWRNAEQRAVELLNDPSFVAPRPF